MNNTKLNKRAMLFFYLFFSIVILLFSGIMIHSAGTHDSERLKYISMSFHNVAAIVFTFSTVFHVKYNWKSILNYLKDKREHLVKFPKEMVIAGSTMVFLLILLMMHVFNSHW